jgi:hypothetical protein
MQDRERALYEYGRTCTTCYETQSLREFTNYKDPSIVSRQIPALYVRVCRTCRIEASDTPAVRRVCERCEKLRKEDAFIRVPRHDVAQDEWCRTCRSKIERQWSKGRWKVDGYTNMPWSRGKRSRVKCDDCLVVIERRHISRHDKSCGEK